MNERFDVTPGVGETEPATPLPTELLDFIATEGLRSVYLAASELRVVAGAHPLEFPNTAKHAQALQRVLAYMELGLEQAGYDDKTINRVPRSSVPPAEHDPTKPRTNT